MLTPNPADADSDANGDTLTLLSAQNSDGGNLRTDGISTILPSGATITLRADGTFDYDPTGVANAITDFDRLPAGEIGTETFTYTISDGNGGADTATVSINVTGVKDAPITQSNAASTEFDTPVTFDVVSNDTDPEGDTFGVTAAVSDDGDVTIEEDGTLTFDPNKGFSGDATITYTVTDAFEASSDGTATVTVGGRRAILHRRPSIQRSPRKRTRLQLLASPCWCLMPRETRCHLRNFLSAPEHLSLR